MNIFNLTLWLYILAFIGVLVFFTYVAIKTNRSKEDFIMRFKEHDYSRFRDINAMLKKVRDGKQLYERFADEAISKFPQVIKWRGKSEYDVNIENSQRKRVADILQNEKFTRTHLTTDYLSYKDYLR